MMIEIEALTTESPSSQPPARSMQWHLDQPAAGARFSTDVVTVSGWVLCQEARALELTCEWSGLILPSFWQPGQERLDVAAALGQPEAAKSGFSLSIFTFTITDPHALITLYADFNLSERVVLGRLIFVRYPDDQIRQMSSSMRLRPIGVGASGRSGTTLLMRYFQATTEAVTPANYPFELGLTSHAVDLKNRLTLPIDYARIFDRDQNPETFASANSPLAHPDRLRRNSFEMMWSDQNQEDVRRILRSIVERYYWGLATEQSKAAICFVEKLADYRHQYFDFLKLFPEAYLILLIRDPRDKLASQTSFDQKRGFAGGWYLDVNATLGGFVQQMRQQLRVSIMLIERFPGQVIGIRYEDLVMRPEDSLNEIFGRCGLATASAKISQIIDTVRMADLRYCDHRTSRSAFQSIERWRQDLRPEIAGTITELLRSELAHFGYATDGSFTDITTNLLTTSLRF